MPRLIWFDMLLGHTSSVPILKGKGKDKKKNDKKAKEKSEYLAPKAWIEKQKFPRGLANKLRPTSSTDAANCKMPKRVENPRSAVIWWMRMWTRIVRWCLMCGCHDPLRAVDNGQKLYYGTNSSTAESRVKENVIFEDDIQKELISRLSRYTSNPSYGHWKAITRVLHYLRYSRDYGLHYDRHPAVIEGYSDANWISDIKDSRSTSGYVFTLGGAAILMESFQAN
ncbi:hypothetical protein Tco_0658965 [Tanacetum coccineum]